HRQRHGQYVEPVRRHGRERAPDGPVLAQGAAVARRGADRHAGVVVDVWPVAARDRHAGDELAANVERHAAALDRRDRADAFRTLSTFILSPDDAARIDALAAG